MIKRLMNKWFYPFSRIFEIVVISEDNTYYDGFQKMLTKLFIEKKLHILGVKCEYDNEKELFSVLTNENLIQFKLKKQIVFLHKKTEGSVNFDFKTINGDIAIFITSFDRYNEHDFYSVTTETDRILCNISHLQNVILTYFGTETQTTFITNDVKWHEFINPEYQQLMQKPNETLTCFNNLLNTIRYYSNKNPHFGGRLSCNFFYFDTETQEVRFGQSEFICNFILQLLQFDKMNNYQYLIKN